jgi:poly(3-hydroxybutyrate) depolymerase
MGGTFSTGGTSSTGGAPPMGGSGCGVDPAPAGNASMDVDGQQRTYIVDLPPGYDKNHPYPVLFGFHGATTSGSLFRSQYYGNLLSAAGSDAIVIHPDALGDPTAWDTQRDVPFFDALLAKIESQYCVDENRIFAAGHSSGGFFSNTLGCQRGNVLRGIGPVSGGGPFVFGGNSCTGNVAVWIAHGNMDTTVDVQNGRTSRDFWANRNGCDTGSSTPVSPSPCVEYGGCNAGYAVRYCEYDGDHGYPSFAPQGIWDFFKSL